MDAKYLAEIKAREQAATPGPWEEKTNRHPQCNGEPWGWISGAAGNITWSGYVGKTNADFIAHARTDIPALISEVEQMTKQLEEWRTTYIRMKEQWKHDCDLLVQAGNDNVAKDQQIATLEKALELACEEISDYALPSGTGRMKSVLITARIEKFMNHAKRVQEQEERMIHHE